MNRLKHNQGFTIVELLIVIVVIAILAAISIVAYNGIQQRSRNTAALNLASQVAKKAEVYFTINNAYPTQASHFSGEAALEGMKVTIRTGAPVTPPILTTFNSVQTAFDQYNAYNRVVYTGGATGYDIRYLQDGAVVSMTKGTAPSGTATFVSNENL